MVMAIKRIKSNLPTTNRMNFYNPEDDKRIELIGEETEDTNTWVPYQSSRKQIKIEIINNDQEDSDNLGRIYSEFYFWDDNYKLQCSTIDGIKTILAVSGDSDIGITVNEQGIQAYFV